MLLRIHLMGEAVLFRKSYDNAYTIKCKTADLLRPERVSPDTPLVLRLTGGEDPDTVWEETRWLTGREFYLAALREQSCTEGIECIFERNPGNHFQDVKQRIAKGVAWIVLDTAKGDRLL